MKRAPRSRQRHDLYAKYHDYDSEISDLLGECGVPRRFKHWPPYYGILEMCLTNATLPSKSLGGSSCSLGLGSAGVPLACEGRTGRATR
jgi:hypothetical protein